MASMAWLLALGLLNSTPEAAGESWAAGEPIVTRQSTFSIPFDVESPGEGANAPSQVRLLVSEDGGQTWRLHAQVPPAENAFHFQAPRDQEYWFAIGTVGRDGRIEPEGPPRPELRVVVDRAGPAVELSAERQPDGGIQIRWRAVDPHLDPASVTITAQAQTPGAASTAVGAASGGADGSAGPIALSRPRPKSIVTGEARAAADPSGAAVVVRLAARDRAGNETISTAEVAGWAPRASAVGGAAAGPTIAGPWTESAGSPPPTVGPPAGTPYAPSAADPGPLVEIIDGPAVPGYVPAAVGRAAPLTAPRPSQASAPTYRGGPVPPAGAAPLAAAEKSLPEVEPLWVNALEFELDYRVDGADAGSVSRVEVYGTRDGGRTWVSLGTDDDKQSPCLVNVDREGLYGFAIVITTSHGAQGEIPLPGTPPETVIGVDLTAPEVRLTTAEPGAGGGPGSMTLRWTARDAHLADRPIALYFAAGPEGPWTLLEAQLEDRGAATVQFPADAPTHVYLRIEAQDRAGNTGRFATTQPVQMPAAMAGPRTVRDGGAHAGARWYHVLR